MRLSSALVSMVVVSMLVASPLAAQRRRRPPPPPPPVTLEVAPDTTAGAPLTRWTVSLRAQGDVEVVADRRLLWLEVLPAGARRPLRCESPARPRRADSDRVRTLHAGETWGEWLDVRGLCWGAARRALEAGADVTAHFGSPRARIDVAHDANGAWRELVQVSTHFAGWTPPAEPTSEVRVALADADALSFARLTFRVSVRATRSVRAWVRPDRFRFRVVSPDGGSHVCEIPRGGGAAIPDLFARLGTSRGAMRALAAREYCGADLFAFEGIYEVTPILELDASGAAWRMDTPLGTFEGRPAIVRIRAGERGYVERPIGGRP